MVNVCYDTIRLVQGMYNIMWYNFPIWSAKYLKKSQMFYIFK